ncbi:MAG: DEAD/DEAH box helicase family protein, partial [Bacillales bacterium]|nr:DEAD/DEAH box helicase family protein [Bacillales bacterium]
MNFKYLEKTNFTDLMLYCQTAEESVKSDPSLSASYSRKALEYLVKYIYALKKWDVSDRASLFELTTTQQFDLFINSSQLIAIIHYIRKIGNSAIHNEKVSYKEANLSLINLHAFIGELLIKLNIIKEYPPFEEATSVAKIIEPAIDINKDVTFSINSKVLEYKLNGNLNSNLNISEAKTRELYIDTSLKESKWELHTLKGVVSPLKACIEIEVQGMPNNQGVGYVDYVLFGNDCKPLAIIEAKKTNVDPEKGKQQAILYAECLERQYGYQPIIYYSNGYETRIIDGNGYPSRLVYGYHTADELQLLLQRRVYQSINDFQINDDITNRPYQKMAITKTLEHYNLKKRKALLVMATGTGKTRIAISLVEILQRNSFIKNVLFLADRTALVNQAHKGFTKFLPAVTTSKLTESNNDKNARILFSTYQTLINMIDNDNKVFGIGRFDLIIIDEAHRSIFNKYKAIFGYFDSLLFGLTATPRSEIERSTYITFDLEDGNPNFDYEIEEAVKDKYLVGYTILDRTTKFLKQGIKYKELTKEEKEIYEEKFSDENGKFEEEISGNDFFKLVYNDNTVDRV